MAFVSIEARTGRRLDVVVDSGWNGDDLNPDRWIFTPPVGRLPVACVGVTRITDTTAVVDVAPPLEVGVSYDVRHLDFSGTDFVVGPASEDPALDLGILEGLTLGVGELLQELGGVPYTRTTRAFALGDHSIPVLDASSFPSSGSFEVFVGGKVVRVREVHASKTRLDDVVDLGVDGETVPVGEGVFLNPLSLPYPDATDAMLSALDRAFFDTLIHRARGEWFDGLAAHYGLERLRVFDVERWRGVLRAAALGARGTFGCVWECLASLYRPLEVEFSVSFSASNPQRITFVSSSGDRTAFSDLDLGRWVEVRFIPADVDPFDDEAPLEEWPWRSVVFWSVGPSSGSGSTSAFIECAEVGTGLWEACDWAEGENAIHPTYTAGYARILKFYTVEPALGPRDVGTPESATQATVRVYADDTLVDIPPAYLLDPAGVDRATLTPSPPPVGGFILDEFNLDGLDPAPPPSSDVASGLSPVYLQGEDTGIIRRVLSLLLPAGVHAEEILLG